jgi:hypothetical protein
VTCLGHSAFAITLPPGLHVFVLVSFDHRKLGLGSRFASARQDSRFLRRPYKTEI